MIFPKIVIILFRQLQLLIRFFKTSKNSYYYNSVPSFLTDYLLPKGPLKIM